MRFVEQHDALAARPAGEGVPPVRVEEVGQPLEGIRPYEGEEQGLATAMRVAVHHHHATVVLDESEGGSREGVAAGEPIAVVELGRGLPARQADDRAHYESGREERRPVGPAAVWDEGVALREQRQRAVRRAGAGDGRGTASARCHVARTFLEEGVVSFRLNGDCPGLFTALRLNCPSTA